MAKPQEVKKIQEKIWELEEEIDNDGDYHYCSIEIDTLEWVLNEVLDEEN